MKTTIEMIIVKQAVMKVSSTGVNVKATEFLFIFQSLIVSYLHITISYVDHIYSQIKYTRSNETVNFDKEPGELLLLNSVFDCDHQCLETNGGRRGKTD